MTFVHNFFYYFFLICGILLITITALSLLNAWHWYFKILNFPRVATLIAMLVCLLFYVLLSENKSAFSLIVTGSLVVAIIIQCYIIFPYTSLAHKKVASAKASEVSKESLLSIVVANVLMKNREAKGLLKMIDDKDPTFVLTMEVNERWENDLKILEKKYPYQIMFAADNTYGMFLYSKLPLSNKEILFLHNDSVPSFHCHVTMPGDKTFQLLTIHPVAPKPSEHPDNMGEKEKGLVKAGRLIAGLQLPAIVAGDFNDVGWSYNTGEFEEVSKLNDVRRGRGLYNTFSAKSLIFKWPLDYVYVSKEFKVLEIERLSGFGSDHYPLYVQLTFNP